MIIVFGIISLAVPVETQSSDFPCRTCVWLSKYRDPFSTWTSFRAIPQERSPWRIRLVPHRAAGSGSVVGRDQARSRCCLPASFFGPPPSSVSPHPRRRKLEVCVGAARRLALQHLRLAAANASRRPEMDPAPSSPSSYGKRAREAYSVRHAGLGAHMHASVCQQQPSSTAWLETTDLAHPRTHPSSESKARLYSYTTLHSR